MRIASYGVTASDGRSLDISVIALGAQAGSLLDNVNRWRNELKLAPITEAELTGAVQSVPIGTMTGQMVNLVSEQATLEGKHKERTLAAIRLNETIATLPQEAAAPDDAHFLSAEEMERRFSDFPDALARTMDIAKRCKFELPIGGSHMPIVPVPPGLTASQQLRQKAIEGALQLYGELTPEIQERLRTAYNIAIEPILERWTERTTLARVEAARKSQAKAKKGARLFEEKRRQSESARGRIRAKLTGGLVK